MDRKSFFSKIFLTQPNTSIYPNNAPFLKGTLKTYKGKWDTPDVVHFLKRTMFGAKPEDVAYFKNISFKNTIKDILNTPSVIKIAPINNYNDDKIIDEEVSLGSTWVDSSLTNGKLNKKRRDSYKQWWIGNMINQDRNITEKMVLFWHNHFATEAHSVDNAIFCYHHNQLLHQYALGNFKEMVKAVTTDLSMLKYLNGNANTKKAPDENFGRELQELFTVGKGPNSKYTEADVKAAAKVLTGYKIDKKTNIYSFDASRHDESDKQFSTFYSNIIIKGRSGEEGTAELDDLINMIFAQEEVSKFIIRKLYRFFIFYKIDETTEREIILPLAKIFRKNNYEIKPVLKALFSSQHFFDINLRGTMIKSPIDLCVGLVREYAITFPTATDLIANYNMWGYLQVQAANMQQNIGDLPNVAGWPAYYQEPQLYKLWINSDTLPKRNQFSDRLMGKGYKAKDDKKIFIDVVAYTKLLPHPEDPDALINDIIQLLYTVNLSAAEKTRIKSSILLSNLQGNESNHYWTNAWNNFVTNPNDETNQKQVIYKLINLYKYLMNRPEYQVY